MVSEASRQPIPVWMQVPSCVPSAKGIETSGAEIGPKEVARALTWPGIIGLGEVMNYPGVTHGDEKMQQELDAARKHLQISKELGIYAALTEARHRWYAVMARLKEAEGDLAGALDLLDEAERQYISGPVLEVHPIAALRAQLCIRQGKLAEVQTWAREHGLTVSRVASPSASRCSTPRCAA